jgi:hypothetical protein
MMMAWLPPNSPGCSSAPAKFRCEPLHTSQDKFGFTPIRAAITEVGRKYKQNVIPPAPVSRPKPIRAAELEASVQSHDADTVRG